MLKAAVYIIAIFILMIFYRDSNIAYSSNHSELSEKSIKNLLLQMSAVINSRNKETINKFFQFY